MSDISEGQSLLTTFLRSLGQLTKQRQICTILVNNIISTTRSEEPRHQGRREADASIFGSIPGKQALGRTLAYLVDRSILLTRIPKSQSDVETAYANPVEQRGACRYVSVFEVLKDRNGSREGSWAAFDFADGVKLLPIKPM